MSLTKISPQIESFTKSYEKLRLVAYDDAQPNVTITKASQIKGTLTIGYGHTKNVSVGQRITKEKAQELFMQDVNEHLLPMLKLIKVPITLNMRDALFDFCFNIGLGNFKKSDTLRLLNLGKYQESANAFLGWSKPKGVIPRRQYCKELFLTDMGVLTYKQEKTKKASENLVKVALGILFFI